MQDFGSITGVRTTTPAPTVNSWKETSSYLGRGIRTYKGGSPTCSFPYIASTSEDAALFTLSFRN